MKKFLLFITVMLVTAVCVHAVAPTTPSVAAERYVYALDNLKKSAGFDTLVGTDSTTLATKITLPAGSTFVLSRGAITGTGADSVALQVVVDCYDFNKAFTKRVVVDSITSANSVCVGEDIAIPFFDSIFGSYFTIKFVPYGSTLNGGQVIMGSATLYTRKLYIETKQTVGSL